MASAYAMPVGIVSGEGGDCKVTRSSGRHYVSDKLRAMLRRYNGGDSLTSAWRFHVAASASECAGGCAGELLGGSWCCAGALRPGDSWWAGGGYGDFAGCGA